MLPGNVERLHKDYEIINRYVINKYGLMNDLMVPDRFEDEALNQISAFDTEGLMQDMNSYSILWIHTLTYVPVGTWVSSRSLITSIK